MKQNEREVEKEKEKKKKKMGRKKMNQVANNNFV